MQRAAPAACRSCQTLGVEVNHTRTEVEAAVRATFPHSDFATILSVVDLYGIEPHEREPERVQLAIIALGQGSEEKLLEFVQAAKTDYRDVLYWAENGPLSEAEGQRQQELVRGLREMWGKQ
jgi:hypothetical protein